MRLEHLLSGAEGRLCFVVSRSRGASVRVLDGLCPVLMSYLLAWLPFGMPVSCCIGGLAQLVEHLLCKQGVNGSSPLSSTFEVIDMLGTRTMVRRLILGAGYAAPGFEVTACHV